MAREYFIEAYPLLADTKAAAQMLRKKIKAAWQPNSSAVMADPAVAIFRRANTQWHPGGNTDVPGAQFFVAFAEGGPVGAASFVPDPARVHGMLGHIYVAEEWTRRGVGRELLRAMIDHARFCQPTQPRLRHLVARVPNDSAAIPFFRRCSLRQVESGSESQIEFRVML